MWGTDAEENRRSLWPGAGKDGQAARTPTTLDPELAVAHPTVAFCSPSVIVGRAGSRIGPVWAGKAEGRKDGGTKTREISEQVIRSVDDLSRLPWRKGAERKRGDEEYM